MSQQDALDALDEPLMSVEEFKSFNIWATPLMEFNKKDRKKTKLNEMASYLNSCLDSLSCLAISDPERERTYLYYRYKLEKIYIRHVRESLNIKPYSIPMDSSHVREYLERNPD